VEHIPSPVVSNEKNIKKGVMRRKENKAVEKREMNGEVFW